MEIIYLEEVASTHIYLKEFIRKNQFTKPLAVVTQFQTNGIGSRDNSWNGAKGNLFFSFAISKDSLPNDLKIESASIYFSYLLKEILASCESKVWIKWPNDFYIDDKKIGGTITTLTKDILMCGIGINLVKVSEDYGILDVCVNINKLLNDYFDLIASKPSWKHIFSNFEIEFTSSKEYQTTINKEKVSLMDAILLEDGSIVIDNKKVYSLR
ncbi:MAG: biotin--[acetyl-CoA-carboxylase] ligase [Arcobacteraceae bacterium]|jgi:BirA family biotin operon repressor/biotin-[acetyl-CoA-carboxylase] ligase|nr:biotin--[acetyl-CoA-carboxylase] ligase [Arcobacteraceae bacterium]